MSGVRLQHGHLGQLIADDLDGCGRGLRSPTELAVMVVTVAVDTTPCG